MKLLCTAESAKNTKFITKPNEDYYICDEARGVFVLLDGVSRDGTAENYPQPSPSAIISEIVANEIYVYTKENLSEKKIENVLLEAMSRGNQAARNYNKGDSDYFLPGTVGVISVIRDNTLYYAYIGDCTGRTIHHDIQNIFTQKQTQLISENQKYFSKREVRVNICNNIFHPYKYGVLYGDEAAMAFVNIGVIALHSSDRIILASDGMDDYLKTLSVKQLKKYNAKEFINNAILFNNEKADDRTIVCIDLISERN